MVEIWGHRGAPHFEPENTMESFETAKSMGVAGLELDIQLSKDGYVVVVHDEKLERTSNGKGFVKDFTLKELKRLNFNKGLKVGKYSIPTLDEVLAWAKLTSLQVNVEFKTGVIFYAGIEQKAWDIVKKHDMLDRVIWSSFNHYSLQNLQEIDKTVQIALLCGGGIFVTGEQCKYVGAEALHPNIRQLHYPGIVAECHARGIKVRAWTVDTPEHFALAKNLKADAVFTNRIDLAKICLEEPK